MERRGFIASLLGAIGIARTPSFLAGSTPSLDTLAPITMKPVLMPSKCDQDKFIEFLWGSMLERKAVFLSGDIGGFTREVSATAHREMIDVTSHTDTHRRFMGGPVEANVNLGLQLQHSQGHIYNFELHVEGLRGFRMEDHLVSPDDVPARSPIIPIFNNHIGKGNPLGHGNPYLGMERPSCLVLIEPQFYVKCVEQDFSLYDPRHGLKGTARF